MIRLANRITELFRKPLKVVNLGLSSFAGSVKSQGADVSHVDWKPPGGGNKKLMEILKKLR